MGTEIGAGSRVGSIPALSSRPTQHANEGFKDPARLLTASLIAFVLMVCALAALALKSSYDLAVSRLESSTRDLSELLLNDINESLGGVDRILRITGALLEQQPEILRDEDVFLEPFAQRQKYLRPEISSLYITDKNGVVVFPTNQPVNIPESVSEQAFFKTLLTAPSSDTAVSEPQTGANGELVLVLARAFNDTDGTFAGVVAATIPVKRYMAQFGQLDQGPRGVFKILHTRDGWTLRFSAASAESRLLAATDVDTDRLLERIGTETGHDLFRSTSEFDGVERLMATSQVEGLPLALAVGSAVADHMGPWYTELQRTAGLILGFTALAALLRWLILRLWRRQLDSRIETETVIESSPVAIYTRDTQGLITQWNAASEALYGWTAEEAIGHPLRGLTDEQRAVSQALIARVAAGETMVDLPLTRPHRSGRTVDINCTVAPLRSSDGQVTGVLTIATDVTEKLQTERRLAHLAYHDALTGLPNRALLQDRFDQAVLQARRNESGLALLFLDIDNFKTINDSLGHTVGDQMLVELGARLQRCMRQTDTVSRHGGDEFLVLLQNVQGLAPVSRLIDTLHHHVRQPFLIDGHEFVCTASIGVALFPRDGEDFNSLQRMADIAMYQAKEAGKDGSRFFDPSMNADAQSHMQICNDLRKGLARGEFELHYQPQIDLQTGALIGVEALIRWRHPQRGLLAPGHFIAAAEDSGLIVPIGEWVVQEACRQAAAWVASGMEPMIMAVNLSALQFKRGSVDEVVRTALGASGLEPRWLELELTESILISNVEEVLGAVHRLKALGVKISIDDFGTGYSSLAYLKRFPADKLKIDQGFVRNVMTDPGDAAIVRAIISLANSLGLTTISEGIETEEIATRLREMGCKEAQGYHFARPMPASSLEAFVAARGGAGAKPLAA